MWDKILDWPVILQGIIGSAIFWGLQLMLTYVGIRLFNLAGKKTRIFKRELLEQEWVYRKFFTNTNIEKTLRGFFFIFQFSFEYIIKALILITLALLLLPFSTFFLIIALVGALFYLLRSLFWITPIILTKDDNLDSNCKRLYELEKILFDKVSPEVKDCLRQKKV